MGAGQWEPDDRIYLVGFSRGAYTVRCVAGVLGLCGIPTRGADGVPLKRDPASAGAIAREAVKQVYQFGNSIAGDPYRPVRLELATRFRTRYASGAPAEPTLSNAYPYFIGVWDTVAALGLTTARTTGLAVALVLTVGVIAIVGNLLHTWLVPGDRFDAASYWWTFAAICGAGVVVGAVAWIRTYVKFTTKSSRPWYKTLHVTGWRVTFYDTELSRHVQHARHALAIDENRKDFDRVPWTLPKDGSLAPSVTDAAAKGVPAAIELQDGGRVWLKQVWFAGVHSDVGGSYIENEARLSDIALRWMVDEARSLPTPLVIDSSALHLWPAADGPQHDERKNTVAGWPGWFVWLLTRFRKRVDLGWTPWVRRIAHDAPLHPSVIERFDATDPGVLHYDVTKPYRPEALRQHLETHKYYQTTPALGSGADNRAVSPP